MDGWMDGWMGGMECCCALSPEKNIMAVFGYLYYMSYITDMSCTVLELSEKHLADSSDARAHPKSEPCANAAVLSF